MTGGVTAGGVTRGGVPPGVVVPTGVVSMGVVLTGGVTTGGVSAGGVTTGGVTTGGVTTGGVSTGGVDVGAMKLFVMVAVQVTVLAPVLPEPSHWLMVVGSPVLCEGGAVAVQVSVPPAPPEALHWSTVWPPGPDVPGRLLPGGVAVQVSVSTVPGLWHWVTVESPAEPIG